MWKEALPKKCPPTKAIEQDIEVYRVLQSNAHNIEDFRNYCQLYPDNPRFKFLCKAYALSFYDTPENAITAMEKSKNLQGSHIGQYLINKTHGVCQYKQESGHYSIWLYDTWDFNNFIPTSIKVINGN